MPDTTFDNPTEGVEDVAIGNAEGTVLDGNPDATVAAPETLPAGTDGGESSPEESFYNGDPTTLDPDVYDKHYKSMQADYSRGKANVAKLTREMEARQAALEAREQELVRERAALYGQPAKDAPSAPTPAAPDSKWLGEDELFAKTAELTRAGKQDEALSLFVQHTAGRQAEEANRALQERYDALEAKLSSLEKPHQLQQQQAQVASAFSRLASLDPTLNSAEVRNRTAEFLNEDAAVAAAIETGNDVLIEAAVERAALRARRDFESGKSRRAAVRASTAPTTAPTKTEETDLGTNSVPSISDAIARFKRKNPDVAERLRLH
jgi:hypothetical protein